MTERIRSRTKSYRNIENFNIRKLDDTLQKILIWMSGICLTCSIGCSLYQPMAMQSDDSDDYYY